MNTDDWEVKACADLEGFFFVVSLRKEQKLASTDEEWAEATQHETEVLELLNAAPDLLDLAIEMLADQETLKPPFRNEAICERARAVIDRATKRRNLHHAG